MHMNVHVSLPPKELPSTKYIPTHDDESEGLFYMFWYYGSALEGLRQWERASLR